MNYLLKKSDPKYICDVLDPLRADVKEAVATATRAGVFVRMVTGTLHSYIKREFN
jgi:hypothetical protein